MDELKHRIAAFGSALRYDDLPADVVLHAKHRLVDALGCGLGALDCEPALIGLELARGTGGGTWPGRIVFSTERAAADAAAFVNTCRIRYLDFNDQRYGGHPSDMLGGLLSIAETAGVDGRGLVAAIAAGYEVALRMTEATRFRQRGWDQGFALGIGTAVGVSSMLGLTAAQTADAVAIAAVGSVPLRATRAGRLSLWKGAATAFACRNGVFAAMLAAKGMTGPESPFEGRHGLFEQITGEFTYETLPSEGGRWLIPQVNMKYWPVEYNAQIAVWAARELRELMPIEDIEAMAIDTYWSAWHEIGSEPAKWDPQSRETADHSMPYCFARTLVDGHIDLDSFSEAAYLDPTLRPLMAKISIREDEEINSAFPDTVRIRVAVTDRAGQRRLIEMSDPRGHARNPMTTEEIDDKFLRLARPMLGATTADEALAAWRRIERADVLTPPLDLLLPG